jgi:hypothetical protein
LRARYDGDAKVVDRHWVPRSLCRTDVRPA